MFVSFFAYSDYHLKRLRASSYNIYTLNSISFFLFSSCWFFFGNKVAIKRSRSGKNSDCPKGGTVVSVNSIIFRRSCFKRTKLKIPRRYRHLHRVETNLQFCRIPLCVSRVNLCYRHPPQKNIEFFFHSFFFSFFFFPYLSFSLSTVLEFFFFFFFFRFILRLVSNTCEFSVFPFFLTLSRAHTLLLSCSLSLSLSLSLFRCLSHSLALALVFSRLLFN